SDGTDEIRFMEPKKLEVKRRVKVRYQGRPVTQLNELEWIDGEIWANIWKSDRIARIDPETGAVTAWVDLRGLLKGVRLAQPEEEVLNGIAWDAEGQRLFVTGKRWPYLFHIELREKP
ncbi:MAG: glutaminyl-peptide cyclotransferase, partial [Planctomycetota bacterium]